MTIIKHYINNRWLYVFCECMELVKWSFIVIVLSSL